MKTLVAFLSVFVSVLAAPQKRDNVCYPPFGCFESTDKLVKLPQDPSVINTHYYLYTRQHPTHAEAVLGGPNWQSQLDSFARHVDISKKTKILIHGFLNSATTDWLSRMTAELLKKGDFNIIVVGWGSGSKWPYEQAAGNAFLVGAEVSSFIKYLHQDFHLNYADVHIIGHSLGAQIAGLAGGQVSKIGRISGLDPADPGFTGKPLEKRLDSSDATFVDIIHTDGSQFNLVGGYGMKDACGHVDFYPNGGEHQPGCVEQPISSALANLFHGSIQAASMSLSCSHGRAHEYYIESINSPCNFYSHSCQSFSDFDAGKCLGCPSVGCAVMGYHADQSPVLGNQYLSTSNDAKYCGKEYYMEVHISHAIHQTYGELFATLIGTNGQSEELKFSRHMQYYQHDQVEKHVVSSHHANLGDIRSVKLKFVLGSGSHSHGAAHELSIRSIIVEPAENPSSRVKFCGHDASIHESSTHTFSSVSGC